MRLIQIIVLIALVACTPRPQLNGTIDAAARNAPYPVLVPLAPLLAQADAAAATSQITPASVADFDARIAALHARAIRLRGPVISAATRARMRAGINTSALR